MPRLIVRVLKSFDSILVRLKVELAEDYIVKTLEFRFHTGSIKSTEEFDAASAWQEFRFHTGSIKSKALQISLRHTITRFDSILVRLKVQDMTVLDRTLYACFDSILVRLKALL